MTLVAGATGLLGTEVCRCLAVAGKPLRAMVRKTSDPAKKEILRELGAEQVEGDLKDRQSLDSACRGVADVITTPTAIGSSQPGDSFETVDLHGQMQLVDAARAANVQQFVFISVAGDFGKEGGNPLIDVKRAVEKHLRESGLTYTIVRPSCFMEIWLSPRLGFDFRNARATIYGSGQNAISRAVNARPAVSRKKPQEETVCWRLGLNRQIEKRLAVCKIHARIPRSSLHNDLD